MELEREEIIVQDIRARFNIEGEVKRSKRILVEVEKGDLLKVSKWIKERGFEHIS